MHMTIGKRIAHARQHAGLSQKELANKVGISRGYLAGIETTFENVKSKLLQKFSIALSMPLSYFFGEDNAELTEFAEKARKYDKLVSLINNSGLIEGGVENNVVVSGNENHVIVNPEQQMIIEQMLKRGTEERDLIMKILKFEEGKKKALQKVVRAFKKPYRQNRKRKKSRH